MRHHDSAASVLAAALAAIALLPAAAHAASPDDDFADGVRGPQWSLVQDDPAHLSLAEQNGRLEVLGSPGGASSDDALYLSDGPAGFRLSTAADFSVAVAFDLGSRPGTGSISDAIGLDFGVGRDLDGTDSAAIALAYAGGLNFPAALVVAHRTDGAQTTDAGPTLQLFSSGTFLISYDAAGDDLSLGLDDGRPAAFVLWDTVRGVWGADDLLVSFGARGSGFALDSGDAFLDDFAVRSGVVIAVPEPSSLALLGVGGLAPLRRRRSR